MSPALVILAAGLSTRFGGGLKQLTPVGPADETLMDYAIHDAILAGFGSIVLVVRPELRAAVETRVTRWASRIEVNIAEQSVAQLLAEYPWLVERSRPLGTVHAILAAQHFVDTSFVVMNADDYYGPDAFHQLAATLARDAGMADHRVRGCLAAYRLGDTLSAAGGVTRAICTVSGDGFLAAVDEAYDVRDVDGVISGDVRGQRQMLDADATVSTNLWGFECRMFPILSEALHEFLAARPDGPADCDELRIADVVMGRLEQGTATVRVLPTGGLWFGMTYESDLPGVRQRVVALVDRRVYPADLLAAIDEETSSGPRQ